VRTRASLHIVRTGPDTSVNRTAYAVIAIRIVKTTTRYLCPAAANTVGANLAALAEIACGTGGAVHCIRIHRALCL
jgi:hypothetical protein